MTAQSFLAETDRPSRRPPPHSNGLVQLGWSHFWLFGAILAGMLSMLAAIILAILLSN